MTKKMKQENDRFDFEYDLEIPKHIAIFLLNKKTDQISKALKKNGLLKGMGLDIGCGTGWHCLKLSQKGYCLTGIDYSGSQVKKAIELHKNKKIDFYQLDCSKSLASLKKKFDFIYAINSIHHLPSVADQKNAFKEINKVLKKDGLFILHEINTKNPLIRFYVNYIFPMIRKIDDGTEIWVSDKSEIFPAGWQKQSIEYSTFVPDFCPKILLRPAIFLESLLEKIGLGRFGAHMMIVFRKTSDE